MIKAGVTLIHSRHAGHFLSSAAMSAVAVRLISSSNVVLPRPLSLECLSVKRWQFRFRSTASGLARASFERPDQARLWIDRFPVLARISRASRLLPKVVCPCRCRCGHLPPPLPFSTVGHCVERRQQRQRNAADVSCDLSSAAGMVLRNRGNGGLETSGGHVFTPRRAFAGDNSESCATLTDLEKEKFKEVKIEPTNTLFTLPTVLTLARVAAVPAILAVFYSNQSWATAAGVGIFVFAALTDWLDGYLARKMGTSSAFGAFLDPVADKLMVATALVLLCSKPLSITELAAIPWLLPVPTIAIIGREITMSAVREWAATQGGDLHKAVAVSSLGKIKTASQMVAITLLLASGEGGLDSKLAGVLGVSLLYISAILASWSLGMYMRGIKGSLFK